MWNKERWFKEWKKSSRWKRDIKTKHEREPLEEFEKIKEKAEQKKKVLTDVFDRKKEKEMYNHQWPMDWEKRWNRRRSLKVYLRKNILG